MILQSTVWIDVEDMFEYARFSPRPSGIQRLAYEMELDLQTRFGATGRIRFLRHDATGNDFVAVAWEDVAALYARLTATEEAIATRLASWPPEPRQRLAAAALNQCQAIGSFALFLRHVGQALVRPFRRSGAAGVARIAGSHPVPKGQGFAESVRPGDVLMVIGAPWFQPNYPAMVAKARSRHGMRVGLLIYDIIPLRRPEWCDRGLVRVFRGWLLAQLRVTDVLFAISRASADDLERYAARQGIPLAGPVHVIPVGTGFGTDGAHPTPGEARPPVEGDYALVVSTIEARKNHTLLFRVWRRLVAELPPEQVPTLVFAGRVGWLVDDLMQQIENADQLGGKLRIVEDPSDDTLAALYRGCLFTLFPSFYEGWGLPVTESLIFGKPCVISNTTSLPEAGGALARYFDPDDVGDAYRVIRDTITDRAGLAAWQADVRARFTPTPWSASGDAMLAGLDAPPGAASGGRA